MTELDPHGKDPHAPGAKLDSGKPRHWLMLSGFSRALQAVGDVTSVGALKYTPNGWAEVPDGIERYMDAFARHALQFGAGEVFDADTGTRHKAQMIWNLLASLELELRAIEREHAPYKSTPGLGPVKRTPMVWREFPPVGGVGAGGALDRCSTQVERTPNGA